MKISVTKAFTILMLLLIALWLLLWFIDPLGWQLNVFFLKTNDFFADFFNVMIYVSDSDIYHNTINGLYSKIYFPLTYLGMSVFSGFEDYSRLTLNDCYKSHPAMLSCIFFMLISIFLYLHSISKFTGLSSKWIFIIVFSSVFLFTIERGNPIMISAACCFYFLAFKDNKDKKIQLIALLSLCLAAVLKGYPAIFGLFLLKDRRFKDIFMCCVVTLIFVFVPFLAFDNGFDNIPQLISNVSIHNKLYLTSIYPRFGLPVFISLLTSFLHKPLPVLLYVAIIIGYVLAFISIIIFFKGKEMWKQMFLLCAIIAYIPADNGFYCGIYFIPTIYLFLKSNEGRKIDYLYMLLFCVFLNPVQIVIHNIAISWMLSNLAILTMWLLLLIECTNSYRIEKKHCNEQ